MKAKEARELTDDELRLRLEQTRREMFTLRMQKAASRAENPTRIRQLRRDAARCLTVQSERKRGTT